MEITADWNDRDQRERLQRSTVPYFSLPAPFDRYLLMPAAARPYFLSISQWILWTLKMIAGHRSIKKNISCDLSTWAWSMALASSLRVSGATFYGNTCLKPYWSFAFWLWLQNQLFLFCTLWLNEYRHCNCQAVATYFLENAPAESVQQCIKSACSITFIHNCLVWNIFGD